MKNSIDLRWLFVTAYLLIFAFALLSDFSFNIRHEARYSRIFCDMGHRLLKGDVGIDPSVAVNERFYVNGKVLSYYLPFPAMIRDCFRFAGLDQYPLPSILLALALYCFSVYMLWGHVLKLMDCPQQDFLLFAWYPFFLLPVISLFVEASVYWEEIIWGLALFMAQAFLFVSFLSNPRTLTKVLLMLVSGAVLFTRPTFACASVVLVAVLFFQETGFKGNAKPSRLPYGLFLGALILLAWLNTERWGDPFQFCDLKHYELNMGAKRGRDTDNSPRLSPVRIPGTFKYYVIGASNNFSPHQPFVKIGGHKLPDFCDIDGVEPCYPISLLLPFHLLAALWGLWAARRLLVPPGKKICDLYAVIAFIPALLMLMLIELALRYRAEFFPFLIFGSMLGIASILKACSQKRLLIDCLLVFFIALGLVVYGVFVERCFWFVAGLHLHNPEFVTQWFGSHAFDHGVFTRYVFSWDVKK